MESSSSALYETSYLEQRLKDLRELHQQQPKDAEDVIRVMKEETEIFIDLIPGYKIKKQDGADTTDKSKAVKSIQKVEQTILSKYEPFINNLFKLSKSTMPRISEQAYESMCELLPCAAHFNFGSSLITGAVEGSDSGNAKVAVKCATAVEDLYSTDGEGEATLKAINVTVNLIKKRGHLINPHIIGALIQLKISAMDVDRQTTEEKKMAKRKNKKMTDQEKRIQKDLNKADAVGSKTERRRTVTHILTRLIAVYLRVLQAAGDANGVRQHRLLVPCLEGVVKFAHLIDVDALNLMLQAIKDLLNDRKTHYLTSLNAVLACAVLTEASEQATIKTNTAGDEFLSSAVCIDFGPAYDNLYRILPFVFSVPTSLELQSFAREKKRAEKWEAMKGMRSGGDDDNAWETMSMATSVATTAHLAHEYINGAAERNKRVALVFRALDLLILKPKFVDFKRLAAFAKRLSTLSVHQPPHICMAILSFINKMTQKKPPLSDLVSLSPENATSLGAYNAFAPTPEFAHADGATMWELSLLNKSYHPTLAKFSRVFQKMAPSARDPMMKKPQGVTERLLLELNSVMKGEPHDILKLHDTSLGFFNPPIQEPPKKKQKLDGSWVTEDAGSRYGDRNGTNAMMQDAESEEEDDDGGEEDDEEEISEEDED